MPPLPHTLHWCVLLSGNILVDLLAVCPVPSSGVARTRLPKHKPAPAVRVQCSFVSSVRFTMLPKKRTCCRCGTAAKDGDLLTFSGQGKAQWVDRRQTLLIPSTVAGSLLSSRGNGLPCEPSAFTKPLDSEEFSKQNVPRLVCNSATIPRRTRSRKRVSV